MEDIITKARAFVANHAQEPRYGAVDEMVRGLLSVADERAVEIESLNAEITSIDDAAHDRGTDHTGLAHVVAQALSDAARAVEAAHMERDRVYRELAAVESKHTKAVLDGGKVMDALVKRAHEIMAERDEALAMAETAMREGLSECDRLRSIVERVQISARQLDIARASMNDHDRRTLQSLAATDRGELLKELDGAREESRQWNERATTAEEECERLRNELLAMNAVSASNVTDSLCAEPCGECGGKISPVNHSGRVREYRGVMVAYPDGSVIPTCEACGANWITSDISNHVYGSFREQMRAKNPAQPWTPATACEACKGDEISGCICGMVPRTEPRKPPCNQHGDVVALINGEWACKACGVGVKL